VDEPTDSNIQDVDVEPDERDREAVDEESLSGRSNVEPAEEQVPDSDQTQEGTSTEQDTGGSATTSEQVDSKKKTSSDLVTLDTLSDKEVISNELKTQRTKELEDQEQDEDWQTAKQVWKEDHPSLTLKTFKQLYIEGKIDHLPWEEYKPKKFIAKEGNVQVSKETTDENEGYIQNAEQTDESIWKNIQNKKPE
jgi:hypothetical protein